MKSTARSNAHHFMFPFSHFNFDRIHPRAFVSFRKHHGQLHRLMHGWAAFRHSYHVLLQHILPIFLKKRVAATHRGQRFQVQKWVQDFVHPDIVGHLVDPSGRRQNGSAGEGRSEGCHRDLLALGGWRRGGTACTSGSAVCFGCHLFLRRAKITVWRTFCRWPPKTFGRKMDNEWSTNRR